MEMMMEDQNVRVNKVVLKLARIDAVKEGISLKQWVDRVIRAELDRRHIKVPK